MITGDIDQRYVVNTGIGGKQPRLSDEGVVPPVPAQSVVARPTLQMIISGRPPATAEPPHA